MAGYKLTRPFRGSLTEKTTRDSMPRSVDRWASLLVAAALLLLASCSDSSSDQIRSEVIYHDHAVVVSPYHRPAICCKQPKVHYMNHPIMAMLMHKCRTGQAGKVVLHQTGITGQRVALNLEAQRAGVYIVQIEGSGIRCSKRLLLH